MCSMDAIPTLETLSGPKDLDRRLSIDIVSVVECSWPKKDCNAPGINSWFILIHSSHRQCKDLRGRSVTCKPSPIFVLTTYV
jgi:hypothetical protein